MTDALHNHGPDAREDYERQGQLRLPGVSPGKARLLVGDCREMLKSLPAESVHCCITSIPYWGLRAYGTEPQVWGGTDPDCEHEWGAEIPGKALRWGDDSTLSEKQATNNGSTSLVKKRGGGGEREYGSYDGKVGRGPAPVLPESHFCQRCGAWRGELGLEPTLSLFLAHIVEVFREVRRVLRKDATLWLNVGDCFAGSVNGRSAAETKAQGTDDRTFRDKPFSTAVDGLKPKDLCMVPHRVAIALQDDGWWCRMDVVWSKPNPMPESITDRPTKAHEYLFLLTWSERYYFDMEAVRERSVSDHPSGNGFKRPQRLSYNGRGKDEQWQVTEGRNLRSVWEIATEPFPGAHFATFPTELPRRCIRAGTSEKGCCPHCGAPWGRVVEVEQVVLTGNTGKAHVPGANNWEGDIPRTRKSVTTTGWRPGCSCPEHLPVPAVVLDPFAGSCTTGVVALQEGREFVGIELQPEYADLGRKRLGVEGKRAWRKMKVGKPKAGQGSLSLLLEE